MERNETPVERAKFLSWLHLLAAVPILMAHAASKDLTAAAQTAAIALALMEQKSRRWEALLESWGPFLNPLFYYTINDVVLLDRVKAAC